MHRDGACHTSATAALGVRLWSERHLEYVDVRKRYALGKGEYGKEEDVSPKFDSIMTTWDDIEDGVVCIWRLSFN